MYFKTVLAGYFSIAATFGVPQVDHYRQVPLLKDKEYFEPWIVDVALYRQDVLILECLFHFNNREALLIRILTQRL